MNYGRYNVKAELGKGAMGVVYKAYDPNLDMFVALKVLRHDRVVSDAFVRRFLAEAKALGRLDWANIVRVYNVDQDEGTVYIAMEYVEGASLVKIMQGKKFSAEEIIDIGITIAESLHYAHEKGVIHRDIKPGNILVRPDGFLKITDFGIARIEDSSAVEQTQAGEILGTPAYMSPEQVMGQPVDGRSDLFSLGIILYELSTGSRPFEGDNMANIFHAITSNEPVQINRLNPAINANLCQVIMKCLKKKANERFESGNALAEALKCCLKEKKQLHEPYPIERNFKKIVFFILGILLLMGIIGGGIYYFGFSATKNMNSPIATAKLVPLQLGSSPSGAKVFIDGTFKGETPMTLELPSGKHDVTVSLVDHYDWEARIQLLEGKETPVFINLVPINEK